ncbi:MAG: hypothetical protein KDB08_11040, partial [Microthrixaceae bacterium]|nr:hypothetical protein [Microthrixaceae bacterium]
MQVKDAIAAGAAHLRSRPWRQFVGDGMLRPVSRPCSPLDIVALAREPEASGLRSAYPRLQES